MERIPTLLGPEGIVVLTTPIGERSMDALERVYDKESLDALLTDFEVLERRVATRRDDLTWLPGIEPGPGERGVVMVIVRPTEA